MIIAASAFPLTALAQGHDTGTIIARVVDIGGAPIPGATITATGAQGARIAYSGVDGSARLRGLTPGLYDVAFEFGGFRTLIREDIRVSATRITVLDTTMELSGVEETVIVVGTSPLVDVTTVNLGATITAEQLELTPTSSGLWSGVLDRIPGLVNPTIDVGGSDSGQQTMVGAHGTQLGQNVFNLNGTTSEAGIQPGAAGMYYSIGSFEEVAVSTGAHDIESQTPGLAINMVSKSGGNQLRGRASFTYANDSFVGDNVTDALRDLGVQQGNPNSLLFDLNLQVGGPIIKDKLFAFFDYWNFKTDRLVEGVPRSEVDDTRLRNYTANLAWQINNEHRLTFRVFDSDKYRGNVGVSVTRPPASAAVQHSFGDRIYQLHWQGVLSDSSFLDVRTSYSPKGFGFTGRRPGSGNPSADYVAAPVTFDLITGAWAGGAPENRTNDRIAELNASYTRYVPGTAVSHDLKMGGGVADIESWRVTSNVGGVWQYTLGGAPYLVQVDNSPQIDVLSTDGEGAAAVAGRRWNLFVQDTITIGERLSITAGLRYDVSSSSLPAQRRLDSAWAGLVPDEQFGEAFRAAEFAASGNVTEFRDLVPRIAFVYDLSGSGRTTLEASYGRYSMQQGSILATAVNRNATGSNTYFWNDNGDGRFEWGEQGLWLGSEFPGSNITFDPELRSPLVDEVVLGFDHQLTRNLAVGASFIYRDTKHQMDDINTGVPYGPVAERLGLEDSYTPVTWLDPGPDGIPGTADDGGPMTVYNQDPSTFGQDAYLVTNPDAWGLDVPMRYKGIEFEVRRRFADRWQLNASYTLSWADVSNFGFGGLVAGGAFDNPNWDINRSGRGPDDRRHNVKLSGNYMFADPVGVNVGVFFRYESGPPALRTFRTPRGLLNQGSVIVKAAGYGLDTNPAGLGETFGAVTILDLRLDKQFRLPGRWGRASLYFDAFNLLNENAVRSAIQTSGSAYGLVQQIVPPRMFRLGFAWDF